MRTSGNSTGLIFLLLVVAVIGISYFVYSSYLKESVNIEKKTVSIPKYVDLTFSFGETGKLPTKYIDLRSNEYTFPISLTNSFDSEVSANVCPSISLNLVNDYYEIKSSCIDFKIGSGNSDGKNVAIPINEEDKKKICNATKITLNISVEHDGVLKSLAELAINQGFPYHQNSKTSSLEINPVIQPNPINLEKDKEFSLSLSVKKFAEKLTINKITANPVETKIVTKRGDYEREEIIGIEGSVSLEEKHEVLLPSETIALGTLPAPSIKVNEKGEVRSVPLNCSNELAKDLKLCELRLDEKISESFKKMYIEIDVFFDSAMHQTEGLFIDKTQCS